LIAIPAPMHAPDQIFAPFTSPDWVYELKFDGYRCMAGVDAGRAEGAEPVERVRLLTKSGADCTKWYPEVVRALASLPGGPHVIDGEACVLRADGTSDFNLLQERARRRKWYAGAPVITYCVFDLLAHDGRLTMNLPLVRRKQLLQELVAGVPGILFVQDLDADANFFKAMVGAGLQIEGVMAKRRDSHYRPGVRSDDWRKIKRPGWQEGRRWRS
jgi:bifunctional non-homologous end joining protein LigD